MSDSSSHKLISSIVLGEEVSVRSEFMRRHKRQVNQCIRRATQVYDEFQQLHVTWGNHDERRMAVALTIHASLQNVLSSLYMLASGYPVAAGNSMRQYVETLAVSLLFADPNLSDFSRYTANKKTFDFSGAVNRLTQKKVSHSLRASLGITSNGWKTLIGTRDFYHLHSHTSVVALGFLLDWRKGQGVVLGAHYDPKKHRVYAKELTARLVALTALVQLVRTVDRAFKRFDSTQSLDASAK